jgi:hypothetical protein
MSDQRQEPGNAYERLEANQRRRREQEAVERSRAEAAPRWPTIVSPWGEDAKRVDEELGVEE